MIFQQRPPTTTAHLITSPEQAAEIIGGYVYGPQDPGRWRVGKDVPIPGTGGTKPWEPPNGDGIGGGRFPDLEPDPDPPTGRTMLITWEGDIGGYLEVLDGEGRYMTWTAEEFEARWQPAAEQVHTSTLRSSGLRG